MSTSAMLNNGVSLPSLFDDFMRPGMNGMMLLRGRAAH